MEMSRGETRVETFTVLDASGQPEDITGCDLWLVVRKRPGDTALLSYSLVLGVSSGITMLDQVTNKGQWQVRIEHEDTLDEDAIPYGTLSFDAWIRDAADVYQPLMLATPFILHQPDVEFPVEP
jgi:hypothetical protein